RGAARERGELRVELAGALRPRARADPAARRAQPAALPALPRRARAGRGRGGGGPARAPAGSSRPARPRRGRRGQAGRTGAPERWRDGDIAVDVETEAELHTRLASGRFDRLRALVPPSLETRVAAHAAGMTVLDAPALATGRLELRAYLREQAVSRVVHRYGNVMHPEGVGYDDRRQPDPTSPEART